jgi:hypothetical protein
MMRTKSNFFFTLVTMIAFTGVLGGCGFLDKSMGERVDDSVLTSKVDVELAAEPNLPSSAIKVTTDRGVVQLSGFVETAEQSARAEKIAKTTSGVKGVVNAITVRESAKYKSGRAATGAAR